MKIAIFGCGVMGQGLAAQLSRHHELVFYDKDEKICQDLEHKGYGHASISLKEELSGSDLVFLAVKPMDISEASKVFTANQITPKVVVSLLAGTPLKILKKNFPHSKIVRIMANLALILGKSLIGLSTEEILTSEEKESITAVCALLGKTIWIPESKMDAFTSVSGSGPAFIFAMIEAMTEAGIAMGFNAHDAQMMVQDMMKGSLALLEELNKHPAELKWRICSPGGTTIAGLKKFEENSVRNGILKTFIAAYERGQELSHSDLA